MCHKKSPNVEFVLKSSQIGVDIMYKPMAGKERAVAQLRIANTTGTSTNFWMNKIKTLTHIIIRL